MRQRLIRFGLLLFLATYVLGRLASAEGTLSNDGLVRFSENGKYGYVNSQGLVVIQASYEAAENFYDGLAAVQKDGEWVVINTHGKIVRPYRLSASVPIRWLGPLRLETSEIGNGVQSYDVRFLLYPENRTAPALAGLEAINASVLGDLVPAKINGKWGYLSRRIPIDHPALAIVIPPQFEAARPFEENVASVRQNGTWIAIDEDGNIVPQSNLKINAPEKALGAPEILNVNY